jgi:hypothetical protein
MAEEEVKRRPSRARHPVIEGQKVCNQCGDAKPFTEDFFAKSVTTRSGLAGTCRICNNKRFVGYNYGLSIADYDRMFEAQGGRCAICKERSDRALCVDHDHATEQVRGLLCNNCNSGIGKLKDDPDRLRAAIAYLERFRS